MIIFNFAHPLTDEQVITIKDIAGISDVEVRNIKVHFDNDKSFEQQVDELFKRLMDELKEVKQFIIVLPGMSAIAVLVYARFYDIFGFYPPYVRLAPVAGAIPVKFEVKEIVGF